ncbi:MAG: porin [Methylotenera sp.]|nr:porin [Methylotenera sp.]
MNNTIKLAVAAALLAGASSASAGIQIPAGDWTVDIGGNVNAYYTNTDTKVKVGGVTIANPKAQNTIGTGLLPSAFGIGAKTRQNDLDVAFQMTFFTGSSSGDNLAPTAVPGGVGGGAAGNNNLNIRQAYLTFGDASWGSIKLGRDLGIFGSDAILSDMTLLGVGTGGPAGGSSTLGRIGSGYIYADWKGQVSYSSPNWNGFSFAAGVMENFVPSPTLSGVTAQKKDMAFEGKVAYDWSGDMAGRVWASAISQKTNDPLTPTNNYTSRGFDIGAKASVAGFGAVAYYYDGKGLDSQAVVAQGLFNGNGEKSKDKGGYVQGTFTVPGVGTKLGASYGQSKSRSAVAGGFDIKNTSWIVGAYHPLTKHLNLVAEYTNQDVKDSVSTGKVSSDTMALGAILFF